MSVIVRSPAVFLVGYFTLVAVLIQLTDICSNFYFILLRMLIFVIILVLVNENLLFVF